MIFNAHMSEKEYSLYRLLNRKKTNEWHLFGIIQTIDPKIKKVIYTISAKSICEEMTLSEKSKETKRFNEKVMRIKAALMGRRVCGTYISHLYLTVN